MNITTSKLAIFGGQPAVQMATPHYVWPRMTPAVYDAVMGQMRRGEISIYDRSGVFSEFEDRFVAYHGGGLHALVQNSGTSALWSMFVGAQLGKGDEVIVPSYSFYASYSPLMWTGATPVFADSGSDGNIDVEDIEEDRKSVV